MSGVSFHFCNIQCLPLPGKASRNWGPVIPCSLWLSIWKLERVYFLYVQYLDPQGTGQVKESDCRSILIPSGLLVKLEQ